MTDSVTLTPHERANRIREVLETDEALTTPVTELLPPGCIMLTAEEAERVRSVAEAEANRAVVEGLIDKWAVEALALLAPTQEPT